MTCPVVLGFSITTTSAGKIMPIYAESAYFGYRDIGNNTIAAEHAVQNFRSN